MTQCALRRARPRARRARWRTARHLDRRHAMTQCARRRAMPRARGVRWRAALSRCAVDDRGELPTVCARCYARASCLVEPPGQLRVPVEHPSLAHIQFGDAAVCGFGRALPFEVGDLARILRKQQGDAAPRGLDRAQHAEVKRGDLDGRRLCDVVTAGSGAAARVSPGTTRARVNRAQHDERL